MFAIIKITTKLDSQFDKSDPDPKKIIFGPEHCLEKRKFVLKFMKIGLN